MKSFCYDLIVINKFTHSFMAFMSYLSDRAYRFHWAAGTLTYKSLLEWYAIDHSLLCILPVDVL